MRLGLTAIACATLLATAAANGAGVLAFTPEETARILQHGPWPPSALADASNRVSGHLAAAAFGRQLFFDPRLSATGERSCAICHVPEAAWTDSRARALGVAEGSRNTPSLLNVRFSRWFGWAGASDSLWSASVRPLLDPLEMGPAEAPVATRMRSHADLACGYRAAFGRAPPDDDEALLADVGKALAAFQERLVTGRTRFDDFRDALERGDMVAAERYPLSAQRGLRLFVGAAGCSACHVGPLFTNREFDRVGIPVRGIHGRFDWGRYDGIKAVRAGRFSLLSRHSDDASRSTALGTRHVKLDAEAYGAFRVPGLRNVALTAPYMHNGTVPTLRDVLEHYSEIDEVKLAVATSTPHVEPDALDQSPVRPASVLRTLNLSGGDVDDLLAFLGTLTEKLRPAEAARGFGHAPKLHCGSAKAPSRLGRAQFASHAGP